MRIVLLALFFGSVTFAGCAGVADNLFPSANNARPVAPGDPMTREQLIERLGKPRAEVGLSDVSYLRFERSAVALRDQQVLRTWRNKGRDRVYNLTVDAMARAPAAPGLVILLPVAPMIRESLEFREAAQYLSPVLSQLGYAPTDDETQAQYVVSVGFGISAGSEWTETTYRPVFTYSPGQQSAFTATCVGCQTVYGTVSTQGQLQAAYVPEQRRRATYVRFLDLRAVDATSLREGREPAEAWTVSIRSSGPSSDLRRVLPVMVAAAWERIGADTGHQESLRYSDATLRVIAVRHAAE